MIAQVLIYATMIGFSMGQQVVSRYPMIQQSVRFDQQQPARESREDTNCAVLRPSNPDCCFMTDRNHERTQGSEPLSSSPYLINLVSGNKGTLNKFEKVTVNGTVLWKLTPLKRDPENREEKIPGGPIRMEVRFI